MKYIALLCAYLLGSIPWALVVGKLFYQTDIRQHGSGNLGGTNAGRVLGKYAGISVITLDITKGFIAMWLTSYIAPELIIYAGLLACVGHCFPIFAKFKGGKAVATSFGYLIGICIFVTYDPYLFIIAGLTFITVLYLSKMVSLASMLTLFIVTLASFILQYSIHVSFSLLVLATFVIYRHHGNIKRILQHEEKKITWL